MLCRQQQRRTERTVGIKRDKRNLAFNTAGGWVVLLDTLVMPIARSFISAVGMGCETDEARPMIIKKAGQNGRFLIPLIYY
jgi:hypothetical protein